MSEKIKVALICHFTNKEIQKKLGIKRGLNEFSPWIVATINELQKRDSVELHVISPHQYIKRIKTFNIGTVVYHFYNINIPLFHRGWPGFFRFDYITNFYFNRLKVKRIIKIITPDIVHLYGAENPYYSSVIVDLLAYPHIVTIQGFLSRYNIVPKTLVQKKRFGFEKIILSKAKNFGVRYKFMEDETKTLNLTANFYWHQVPVNVYKPTHIDKKFDCVFFAHVSREKGVEDLIRAISHVKKERKNITLKILGKATKEYINYLKNLSEELKCTNNITFEGFIPSQQELHEIVSESRLCVLPTYNDTVPGTIIESMFLETAVIAYKTGGIPTLNEKYKTIEIVDQGDIKSLAYKIVYLLENETERQAMVRNAEKLAIERYSQESSITDLVNAYNKILFKN